MQLSSLCEPFESGSVVVFVQKTKERGAGVEQLPAPQIGWGENCGESVGCLGSGSPHQVSQCCQFVIWAPITIILYRIIVTLNSSNHRLWRHSANRVTSILRHWERQQGHIIVRMLLPFTSMLISWDREPIMYAKKNLLYPCCFPKVSSPGVLVFGKSQGYQNWREQLSSRLGWTCSAKLIRGIYTTLLS